ncbi:hypothetical protein OS493_040328 [Desmophyllum pertusum]|uniref:Uncharacterized protein n=1 Tax=Desmophyllum pertusum TaxID=174260 RepID=A0A9W9YKB6_9CNID|nr:hypothetical protein OS493_040328 [Desmophyllum pertusum]
MSKELSNPQEKEEQRAASVSSEVVNIVENFMEEEGEYRLEVTNQVLEGMSDTEVSNNSTIGSVVMEVNDTDAQNGDNECPVSGNTNLKATRKRKSKTQKI